MCLTKSFVPLLTLSSQTTDKAFFVFHIRVVDQWPIDYKGSITWSHDHITLMKHNHNEIVHFRLTFKIHPAPIKSIFNLIQSGETMTSAQNDLKSLEWIILFLVRSEEKQVGVKTCWDSLTKEAAQPSLTGEPSINIRSLSQVSSISQWCLKPPQGKKNT